MFHRIIVPLDGSHLAAQAVPYAVTLARACDAPITLLGVIASAASASLVPASEGMSGIGAVYVAAEPRATAVDDYLAAVATAIGAHDVAATPVVRRGNPAAEVVACAAEEPGTLVVLTSYGRSGVRTGQLGGVVQHVVRHATAPTLVVRPHPDAPSEGVAAIPKVTVTLDGSLLAEDALPVAAALAARLGAPLTLLRIIPNRVYHALYALEGPDAPPVDERERAEEQEAEEYLTRIAKRLRAQGVTVRTAWRRAAPKRVDETIVAQIAAQAGGILVMASHGRGGVLRWVLGSTTEAVLADAACPVLVVRAGTATAEQPIDAGRPQMQPPEVLGDGVG